MKVPPNPVGHALEDPVEDVLWGLDIPVYVYTQYRKGEKAVEPGVVRG